MKGKRGNVFVVHRKAVAICGAIVIVIAVAVGIAYEKGVIGGEYLPAPGPGVRRMPITYDTTGAPSANAPILTFTRQDGQVVSISLYSLSHPSDGRPQFIAWVGNDPEYKRTGSVITVGQSAVLDGVRVTVVANWHGSKYRSDALDLLLADAGGAG